MLWIMRVPGYVLTQLYQDSMSGSKMVYVGVAVEYIGPDF